jgi:hypothetical protein
MLADNMGYGDPGRYGSDGELRGMPTPRIDEFSGEGLRMSQFFVEPGCRGATAPRSSSIPKWQSSLLERANEAIGVLLADSADRQIAEFRSTANEANIALSFKALSDILASTAGWAPAPPNGRLPRHQVRLEAKAWSGFGSRL